MREGDLEAAARTAFKDFHRLLGVETNNIVLLICVGSLLICVGSDHARGRQVRLGLAEQLCDLDILRCQQGRGPRAPRSTTTTSIGTSRSPSSDHSFAASSTAGSITSTP